MRIVFLGTPDFGVPSLKALAEAGYEVVGVFTQPDKPKGRGNKMLPSPVKVCAQGYGIPVFQPAKIRVDGVDDLRALAIDATMNDTVKLSRIKPLGAKEVERIYRNAK